MITLSLSVHQIVDFLFRSGDIDDRIYNTSSMLEGTRLHKFYQDRQGNNYLKEYYLKYIFYVDDYELIVDGRSDGIILGPIVTIEEIKTTVCPICQGKKEVRYTQKVYSLVRETAKSKSQITI